MQSPTKLDYILRWEEALRKTSSQQKTRVYRITEWIRLERTLKTTQFQLPAMGKAATHQTRLPIQGPIQPRLKYLQGVQDKCLAVFFLFLFYAHEQLKSWTVGAEDMAAGS